MDRWVTPSKLVTTPTWGPPPQALKRINFSRQKKTNEVTFVKNVLKSKIEKLYQT